MKKLCGATGDCPLHVTRNGRCEQHQPGWEIRQLHRCAEDILTGMRPPPYPYEIGNAA